MTADQAPPAGPPLSREKVEALPDNTPIIVVWSGGNGPFRYTARRPVPDRVIAWMDESDRPGAWQQWGHRELTGDQAFVGQERFHTRVWLAGRMG